MASAISEILGHSGVATLVAEAIVRLRPKSVILFGSRATGKARATSDFDIALFGIGASHDEWVSFLNDATESPATLLPIQWIDARTASAELLSEIRKDGITLYEET